VLAEIWRAAGGEAAHLADVEVISAGNLPSVFAVSDLAAAAVGAAAAAIAELIAARHDVRVPVRVDRRLASMWFGFSVRPDGWELPALWDPIAGDYRTHDGWLRLHTNAPHHRATALAVLGVPPDKDAVTRAVARWNAVELETAVVTAGGCAAAMHSIAEWRAHAQGQAVATEPLVSAHATDGAEAPAWTVPRARPLTGVRVLDLTRVLAGPVATRFLAGFGADVLRIDPPWWDEAALVPEVTLGKRCAHLDLRAVAGRQQFERLLGTADVFVHGYRPGALDRLGFGAERRREIRPGLIDVALDAYGWTGPWSGRRGFDSLVQMSTGIAAAGMEHLQRERPTPLPVQALDHAAGYLLAAAAVRGLTERLATNRGMQARTSLARVAAFLTSRPPAALGEPLAPESPADCSPAVEHTAWGAAHRLLPPVNVDGAPMTWSQAAGELGRAEATW
jgi:hypothetical protein